MDDLTAICVYLIVIIKAIAVINVLLNGIEQDHPRYHQDTFANATFDYRAVVTIFGNKNRPKIFRIEEKKN